MTLDDASIEAWRAVRRIDLRQWELAGRYHRSALLILQSGLPPKQHARARSWLFGIEVYMVIATDHINAGRCDLRTIRAAIAARARVDIVHSNDTGEWRYSVVLVDEPGFWMHSFATESEAIAYCKRHRLHTTCTHA